jgi:hypothetical protein
MEARTPVIGGARTATSPAVTVELDVVDGIAAGEGVAVLGQRVGLECEVGGA